MKLVKEATLSVYKLMHEGLHLFFKKAEFNEEGKRVELFDSSGFIGSFQGDRADEFMSQYRTLISRNKRSVKRSEQSVDEIRQIISEV